MQEINFLNLEYLLLRAYEFFFSVPIVQEVTEEAQEPASETLRSVAVFFGQVAIAGMVLTIILIILIAWVRVRIVIVEHEGFEEKEKRMRKAPYPDEDIRQDQAPTVKNPQWERVRTLADSLDESDWRRAILEADILLGNLLEAQGYRGNGVGERLKDANPLQFETLDLAWKAHKVRNDIAHGGESYLLSQRDTNMTIDLYRRVFEEFRYI